jgi:hypothetical protein
VRRDIACNPVGGGIWEVEVAYGTGEFPSGQTNQPDVVAPFDDDTPLESSFSFSIEAPRFKITQSLATISKTKRGGGVAKDYMGAIAPDKDGKVQGAEVPPQPRMTFQRTVRRPIITLLYGRVLLELAGRTNHAMWYGYGARSLLYMGCEASFNQGEGWELTHKFGVEPTLKDVPICAGLVVPEKKGFEYLWVDYEETTDGAGKLVTVPAAAYVEQVFLDGPFNLIGIG